MKNKIDKKIKPTVFILNKLDIKTTGSCEGHISYGSPCPWIKISESIDNNLKKETIKLIKEFYKNKKINKNINLKLKDGKSGFWLYTGPKKDFENWRKLVDKTAKTISKGKTPEKYMISEKEKGFRKINLLKYQQEIKEFTKFLKTKI